MKGCVVGLMIGWMEECVDWCMDRFIRVDGWVKGCVNG